MTLIDTSAWIEFFRAKSKTADVVESLIDDNQAALCGPVLTEIARGIVSQREKNSVLELFSGCPVLSQPSDLWREAGEIGAFLRGKGQAVKTVDLLIASYVIGHQIPILTLDSDFTRMKKAGLPINLY